MKPSAVPGLGLPTDRLENGAGSGCCSELPVENGRDRDSGRAEVTRRTGTAQSMVVRQSAIDGFKIPGDHEHMPEGDSSVQRTRAGCPHRPLQIHLLSPLLFNRKGSYVEAKLRPRSVHRAEGRSNCGCRRSGDSRRWTREVASRAAAAYGKPDVLNALEERTVKLVICTPANDALMRNIAELLTRPVGRPT